MVLIYSTIFEKKARSLVSNGLEFMKPFFKANNGFELLNHVSSKKASKQMVLNCKTIFQRASKQKNIYENRLN